MHIRSVIHICIASAVALHLSAFALAQQTKPAWVAPPQVYPIRQEGFSQSLNGQWSFKFISSLDPGEDKGFYAPAFDVTKWKTIPVPGNWEMHGFAEPHYYMDLQDGLGLYRRTFRIPANWRGDRRVVLRFEGVTFGFEAWVNGKKVGASVGSGFNPTSLDISDAISSDPNAENTLALQVTTKPLGWQSDVWDDWDLSGIYRDVTVFSVPNTHIQDLTTKTKVLASGAADLSVTVRASSAKATLLAKLVSPDGKVIQDFELKRNSAGLFETLVHVPSAQLWTAETPYLYRLQIALSENGQQLQSLEERIGLREVTIVDGILRLNGRPIKLHGVDRHDEAPDVGRAMTEAHWRQDLKRMQEGNINFVRTSHAPPHSRFLDLCDEYGMYVLCEVPLAHFQKNLKNDPTYATARVDQTINRDKNHASVIAWSIGNENGISEGLLDAGRRAKEVDPTRPICYPMVGTSFDKEPGVFPPFVDMYALHYPTNDMLRKWAETLDRPVILTEYAHANGLAGDHIQGQWDIMQASPHFAGGAIWHLMDQGLLQTAEKPVDRAKPTSTVWTDATHYYDTHGTAGQDGILYADRTPQTDFWVTRKAYAPVQFLESAAAVKPGAQRVSITIQNRYDFRSLEGMKVLWSFDRNGKSQQMGEVKLKAISRGEEKIEIPITLSGDEPDVLSLNLRCVDENGLQINERAVRLELPGVIPQTWLTSLPALGKPQVVDGQNEVVIQTPAWTLTVSRKTGELGIRDRSGQTLVSGIYPHVGRKLTEPERGRVKRLDMWPVSVLDQVESPKIKVESQGDTTRVFVSGRYPRPGAPDQALDGTYQADIAANGTISIQYKFAFSNTKGTLAEAGLTMALPLGMTEFRWIGMGPYSGYPGKDRLNDFGIFHLTREDMRFQGNRRDTELALLTTANGAGIAFASDRGDVAVEGNGKQMFLSSNALMSSLGEKGRSPETLIDAAKVQSISGSFTLLPISDAWPTPLTRVFGDPKATYEIYKPFYHSYDQ